MDFPRPYLDIPLIYYILFVMDFPKPYLDIPLIYYKLY